MCSRNFPYYLVLVLLWPLMAMQCEKERNGISIEEEIPCPEGDTLCELRKLPPITTTGANTFACLLNGKAWIATRGGAIAKNHLDGDYWQHIFHAEGAIFNNEGGLQEYIDVTAFNYYFDTDSIVIADNADGSGTYSIPSDPACNTYEERKNLDGHIKVLRLDTLNTIISLTFEFTFVVDYYDAYREYCRTDTHRVSHGRADIEYRP